MRVTIFTQDERVYLPIAIGILVEAMPEKVACLVFSPPMSTHGGVIRGLMKHLRVFGLRGTAVMGSRVIASYIGPRLGLRPRGRPYWSGFEVGEKFKIPTFTVDRVNSKKMHRILDDHPADLLVSVSCPRIIHPDTLRYFPRGGINVHSAPLPRYRGLMPTFWVLYHGESKTAVTVHLLAEKLDNGEILLQKWINIAPDETWHTLVTKTKTAAGHAMIEAIQRIEEGTISRRPNPDEESSYFGFPTRQDAETFRARGRRMF